MRGSKEGEKEPSALPLPATHPRLPQQPRAAGVVLLACRNLQLLVLPDLQAKCCFSVESPTLWFVIIMSFE